MIEPIPDNFILLVLAFLAKLFFIAACISIPIYYFYNRMFCKKVIKKKKKLSWDQLGAWERIKLSKEFDKKMKLEKVNKNEVLEVNNAVTKPNTSSKIDFKKTVVEPQITSNLNVLKLTANKEISKAMKNNKLKRENILYLKQMVIGNTRIREAKKYKNDLHCIYSLIKNSDPSEQFLIDLISYIKRLDKIA